MKTLKFLLSAAILVATFSISAQAQNLSETEPDPYKREIGFGTNIILNSIFNSESGPFDFVYRWKGGEGYWRLGTSVGYSKNDNVNNYNSINKFEILQTKLILGREWRQPISKRWLVNYGVDLSGSYGETFRQIEHFSYYSGNNNNVVERINVQKNIEHQYGVNLRPFLGILFMVSERLYLGTEASFFTGFWRKEGTREAYTIDGGERVEETVSSGAKPTEGYDVSIRTNPASNIFLYYRF